MVFLIRRTGARGRYDRSRGRRGPAGRGNFFSKKVTMPKIADVMKGH